MYISFKGGIRLENNSDLPVRKKIETVIAPQTLSFPIPAGYKSTLNEHDRVLKYQCIMTTQTFGDAPLHSPVSGEVVEVGSSVVIANDGEYECCECEFSGDFSQDCYEAGIVDSKGRPTYAKLAQAAQGEYDMLVVNGIEREPFIITAQTIMMGATDELFDGIYRVKKEMGIKKVKICIDSDSDESIKAVKLHLVKRKDIELVVVESSYPQNDESNLVKAAKETGSKNPLALDVQELYRISDCLENKHPQTEKVISLAGDRVKFTKAISVPIGICVGDVLAGWDGMKKTPEKVIKGGPMTGEAQYNLESPVDKSTNAILALSGHEHKYQLEPRCINCGKCVDICPVGLAPVYISKAFRGSDYEGTRKYGVLDCTLCGACAYVCPGRMNLIQEFTAARTYLGENTNG